MNVEGASPRSKLFVPGSRPELFAKALAGQADALSFDLEDSVHEQRKPAARLAVAELLSSKAAGSTPKTLIVRVNAVGTQHFEADVAAVVRPALHWLNLPKTESADALRAAVEVIERAERAHGVQRPLRLLVNVESARALRLAAELAAAHPRVVGLQLGLGDLFEPLGIVRREIGLVRQAMLTMRLAAGEAGVLALDGAFADFADTGGYRAEAELARACGFAGKSCIHPSQVALANAVFSPHAAEIAQARAILQSAREAQAAKLGAHALGGVMIDASFVKRAEAVVAAARRLGLVPE